MKDWTIFCYILYISLSETVSLALQLKILSILCYKFFKPLFLCDFEDTENLEIINKT